MTAIYNCLVPHEFICHRPSAPTTLAEQSAEVQRWRRCRRNITNFM